MRNEDQLSGHDILAAAIRKVPVPGAPLPLSRDGGSIGLSFLESCLRLNHVRRLTERVALSRHGTVEKVTELDVSLDLLDSTQRSASENYNRIRGSRGSKEEPQGDRLWVPIARMPSASAAPVDVVDSNGQRLPKLTQFETSRLVAPGLYRLARTLLATANQYREGSRVGEFLYKADESRWLLESAIYAVLTQRGQATDNYLERNPTPKTVEGPAAERREFALKVLSDERTALAAFYKLLEIAVRDYILVVGLDPLVDEHVLRYDSPTKVELGSASSRFWSWVWTGESAYRIDYKAQVPATLRSYHFVAEVEPDVAIESIYLTTDAEVDIANRLSRDLRKIASRVGEFNRGQLRNSSQKILEVETQTALRDLSELVRRRAWEAQLCGRRLDDKGTPSVRALAWSATSGEATRAEDGQRRASLLHHPLVDAETIHSAAAEIDDTKLGLSLSISTEPPGPRMDGYWRRSPALSAKRSPINVDCRILVRDASESSPNRMLLYCLAIGLTAWLIGSILAGGLWPWSRIDKAPAEVDAVVAVLLLVPGFLYTRLDFSRRGSIASQIRRRTRLVAVSAVAASAVLAACLAAGASAPVLNICMAIAVGGPLASATMLLLWARDGDGTTGIGELDPVEWVDRGHSKPIPVNLTVFSVDSGG